MIPLRLSLLALTALPALAADAPRALPVDDKPAPMAAPAFVDTVTFKIHFEGEDHELGYTAGPVSDRIDEPLDRYSILYEPATQHYTGLEHSNFTWWEFAWPEVSAAIEGSARYEARLRDVGPQGLGDSETDTTGAPLSSTAGPDDSGYVWQMTTDKKRIAGFDCVRWEGTTVAGETIEAWCTAGVMPEVQAAIQTLRAMNEPVALVPVRMLMPTTVFIPFDAMFKAGVTPVLITWGPSQDADKFALVSIKRRDGRLTMFEKPKDYRPTTLMTMDGLTNRNLSAPTQTNMAPAEPAHAHLDNPLPGSGQ
jgi:hypothetical protein